MESGDTKALLLRAAKSEFAKHGFEGATVKQIAESAGVNISLVSYHFNGKEGLFRACFQEIGLERLAAAERLLKTPESTEDFRVRLQLFAEDFFLWQLKEPDVGTIMHRECVGGMPLTQDIFRNTFMKSFQMLSDFFEAASKSGILRPDLPAMTSAGLFFGSLIHVVRTHEVVKENFGLSLEDKAYRDSLVELTIRNLMYGIVKPASEGKHP